LHCMKCGRKIEDQKVFCPDCLAEMEKFPVKPDAVAHIPVRPVAPPAKKKSRRTRDQKPEEQIRRMKLAIRCLCAALLVCIVAFAITAGMLVKLVTDGGANSTIGQNYSTVTQP